MTKPLMTVSDEAKEFLNGQLQGHDNCLGVMIGLNKKGCAGGEYEFSLVNEGDDLSECDQVTDNGVTVFFLRTDLFKLIGSELVLYQDQFSTRLDFDNPNEASRCGCGESISFTLD